jgi:hypothetical protein
MNKESAPYAGTNKNLIEDALEPAMRRLIATALDGNTMTYGDVKRRLEGEANFSTVFTSKIGYVVGELMNKIQEVEPKAPLITVLVVNQRDGPSRGPAGSWGDDFAIQN